MFAGRNGLLSNYMFQVDGTHVNVIEATYNTIFNKKRILAALTHVFLRK